MENRNKIIISLLIYQALTVKEIAALVIQDINLVKGEIFIKGSQEATSKSPKSRTLPLHAKQVLLIDNYLKQDRGRLLKYNKETLEKDYFILGQYGENINPHIISKAINEHRSKADRIPPKKIRQSVIANLLKKEQDTRIVQEFSGHRNTATTVQYKQTEFEALQQAIKQYHPIR